VVLSAMVDGEATPADPVDVRPHLPNCSACRATVRELRRASMPLAAVFPAAGLVLADGPLSKRAGCWAGAHERAVGSMVRAQAILDYRPAATLLLATSACVAETAGPAGAARSVQLLRARRAG
jgi:anti-sigma factor RsiW